ncbi:MAG TPA: hypothetical protein VHK27_05650, partial [Gammaproteobacteria bacterium]|nr:hypothetical protein [Gammaproteobacteria bacterium]
MKSLEARKAYRNKQKDLEQQEREIGGLSKEQTFEEGGGSVATNESDVEDSAKNVRPTNEFKDKTLGNDPGLAQREKDLAAARERTAAQQRQASQQAEGSAGGEDEGSGEDDEPMDAEAADEWVNDTVENIKANLSDLSES